MTHTYTIVLYQIVSLRSPTLFPKASDNTFDNLGKEHQNEKTRQKRKYPTTNFIC